MILLDTHVLIWAVDDDARLGRRAAAHIAEQQESGVIIAAVTIWEIALLASRNRIQLRQPLQLWFEQILSVPGVTVAPIDPATAIDGAMLPDFHKDPADRLIVATARQLDVPLVTADRLILAYAEAGHLQIVDARH